MPSLNVFTSFMFFPLLGFRVYGLGFREILPFLYDSTPPILSFNFPYDHGASA